MTASTSHGSWKVIVAPWHLDDHIRAFPVPAAAELACPRLPAGSRLQRMTRLTASRGAQPQEIIDR